jgi:hypothetical protein
MKKSELKLLQEKLQKVSQPPPSKKRDDLSDELSKMFDDGTVLESQKGAPVPTAAPPGEETPATQRTQATQGSRRTSLPPSPGQPVAPARDYMKVANSIHREAVPAGLFKGKSKLIYDYLYSRTRGAVVPVRSVQVSRREIMDKAGIGSDKTIRENLLHLRSVGLISWGGSIGAQGGNVYTVYLPEEALATQATQATQGSQGTQGSPGQFLPTVPTVESTQGSRGLSDESNDTSGESKTSFKTNTEKTDDEALAGLDSVLRQTAKEITGREPSPVEAERWRELGELLATELKIAAGRTGSVSSVPAFLTEHLRRRLWKKEKAQLEREAGGASPAGNQSQAKPDASKCPDCFGTGMYYPEGYEKGVARCEHKKLR